MWWKPLNGNQHGDGDGDGERVSTARDVSAGDVTRSRALPEGSVAGSVAGSVRAVCGHSISHSRL